MITSDPSSGALVGCSLEPPRSPRARRIGRWLGWDSPPIDHPKNFPELSR